MISGLVVVLMLSSCIRQNWAGNVWAGVEEVHREQRLESIRDQLMPRDESVDFLDEQQVKSLLIEALDLEIDKDTTRSQIWKDLLELSSDQIDCSMDGLVSRSMSQQVYGIHPPLVPYMKHHNDIAVRYCIPSLDQDLAKFSVDFLKQLPMMSRLRDFVHDQLSDANDDDDLHIAYLYEKH